MNLSTLKYVVILLCAMFMLTACSNESASDPQQVDGEAVSNNDAAVDVTTPAEANDTPLELVFHTNSGDNEEAFDSLYGDPLRQQFPHYTITYLRHGEGRTLEELLVQSQTIDILYASISYFFELSSRGSLQYDMSELITKNQLDLDVFEDTLIEGIREASDGGIFALPVTSMVQTLFYNEEIFDIFGEDYPVDGMTWEELHDKAKKVTRTADDKNYLGFAASPAHILGSNPFSYPYIEPETLKPTFEDEIWKQLIQTYFVEPASGRGYMDRVEELNRLPYRGELTNSQELAMFAFNAQFPFIVPDEIEQIPWDLVALPTFKEKPGIGSQASPIVFGVTSMSEHKDEAMGALNYLVSKEMQMNISKQGIMPVLKDKEVQEAFAQDSRFKDKNWQAVFYNELAPIAVKTVYQLPVERIFTAKIPLIVRGELDMNTALRQAVEEAEQTIAELSK